MFLSGSVGPSTYHTTCRLKVTGQMVENGLKIKKIKLLTRQMVQNGLKIKKIKLLLLYKTICLF